PGVGAFADCKAGLEALPGMVDALNEAVLEQQRPFLGICVGMQLMATLGIEYGEHQGLDWIKGKVVKLKPQNADLKIPQIGWNNLSGSTHPVLRSLPKDADAYFVHSYHFVADDSADVLSRIDYGGPVVAAIGRDNRLGVQFHPEKSQAVGLKLLSD